MIKVEAELEWNETRYVITQEWDEIGGTHEDSGVLYQWTDGNYGCDCNRLSFIAADYDVEVPSLEEEYLHPPCGETVRLVSLRVDGRPLDIT